MLSWARKTGLSEHQLLARDWKDSNRDSGLVNFTAVSADPALLQL
jgi:hypothetical protein